MNRYLPILIALILPAHAWAADLTVTVKNPGGQPVRDAVVTLHPVGAAEPGPIRFAWPYRVSQQNLKFDPFVLIVPTGADVTFPNKDAVRHHVYSFSPAHPFELKLYGKDESRSVRFDKIGIIALGCIIQDSMVGFIDVVDTPYAIKTDAAGQAELHGAPAGPATLTVWHPYMKSPNNQVEQRVVLGRDGMTQAVVVQLRPAPDRAHAY